MKRLTEDENDELRSRILSLQQELDFAKEQIVHKDNGKNISPFVLYAYFVWI